MKLEILAAIALPFIGTVLGSAFVFFLKGGMNRTLQRVLTGFAAGVMVAASIWSLIIPAIEQSEHMGKLSFLPAFIGVWAGFLFLLALDHIIPHLHLNSECPEGTPCGLGKSTMLVLAVALHNLPEGMAVGVVAAGWLTGNESISAAGALALALGIALQNLPEGAIISMPLKSGGMKRGKAFGYGVLSGIIEPIGAVATILLAEQLAPTLPYMLAFAAGAMLYVVVEELIPEMSEGEHSNVGTIFFAAGFSLMMVLDVALG
jgi:ZIP family zinc transporter